jgi:hypothetical protein
MNDELIPLSVLQLDLAAAGVGGLPAYLVGRGIAIKLDDIGRECVTRAAARDLLAEQRESEARKARKREEAERQAAERDREWRAQLHRGIPAGLIPEGVAPAAAMLQAAHDARPRRRSMLEDALDGSGTVFHSYGPDGDE